VDVWNGVAWWMSGTAWPGGCLELHGLVDGGMADLVVLVDVVMPARGWTRPNLLYPVATHLATACR